LKIPYIFFEGTCTHLPWLNLVKISRRKFDEILSGSEEKPAGLDLSEPPFQPTISVEITRYDTHAIKIVR